MEETTQTPTLFAKKNTNRNTDGLIEGIDYKFNEDGLVDWKALVPAKFLYVNNDSKNKERIEKKYNKLISEIDPVTDKVEDADLIVALGGLKHILKLRGYDNVSVFVSKAQEDYAAVNCSIDFIPNYETEGRCVSYSDNACAHFNNTKAFGKEYLVETATNRAFARCIRNFLGINIVSKEELGGGNIEAEMAPISNTQQVEKLQKEMEDRGVTWEQLKTKLNEPKEKEKYPNFDVTKCKSEVDLPKEVIFDLITRMKAKIPKKK